MHHSNDKKINRIRNGLLLLILCMGLTGCSKGDIKTQAPESPSTDITSEAPPESESQPTPVTTEAVTEEVTQNTAASEYILPESDSRFYTKEELGILSEADLRLARNEIFARHGRIFTANDLQLYFTAKSWYVPKYTAAEFEQRGEDIFNEYERTNRDLIIAMEQQGAEQDVFSDLIFYGDRIFSINTYTVEGDIIKLTGDICDSGFATKEYLLSLKPGDEIEGYGTVVEVSPDGEVRTEMVVPYSDNPETETITYYLSSDGMGVSYSMGGEGTIHRLVKANVTLIYDTETMFIPVAKEEPYNKPFRELLADRTYEEDYVLWRLHLKQTTGFHIDILEDLGFNYAG